MFSEFWRLEEQDQGDSMAGLWLRDATFLLCPHMRRGWEMERALLRKALISPSSKLTDLI